MTREEAIKKHYKIKCHIEESKKILNLINEIYNSFENRSCENCEYLDTDLICTNENTPCYSEYSGRYDNFCCNKWEQK